MPFALILSFVPTLLSASLLPMFQQMFQQTSHAIYCFSDIYPHA